MGNIKIIRGVFDTKLELQHAGVKAYLDDELNTTSIDDLMPWNYEPILKVYDTEL